MSINPEYSLINTTDFINLSLGTEKTSIKLNDNQDDGFGKVLHKSAVLAVENVSAEDGRITHYLSILANVVFVDLKGEIRQATYIGGTTKQGVIEQVLPNSVVMASAALSELSIEKIVGSELTLDVKYDVFAIVGKNESVNAVRSAEGAYEKTDEITCSTINKRARGSLIAEDEVATKEEVSLVLSSNAQFKITDAKCNMDSVTIEGVYDVDVCYEVVGEEKSINVEKYQIPFKEEIEAVGVTNGERVFYVAQNKMTTVTAYSAEEDKNVLSIKGEGIIDFVSLSKQNYTFVEDIFSKENELLPTIDTITSCNYLGKVSGKESAEQEFEIEEFNRLVAVCSNRANVVATTVEENDYKVDAIAIVSTIIDIDGSLISREFEIPLTILVAKAGDNSSEVFGNLYLSNVKVIETGKGVKVSVDVDAEMTVFDKCANALISDVTVGEEKPESYSAIIFYIAKGNETQLDLSRAVNLSPDEIEKQVSLSFPLVEKQKITLYRQRSSKK